MNYINKNGYRISEMTLGTAQLGQPYGINNTKGMPSVEECRDILQTALDVGITSFDTARAYGKSEEILGSFFEGKSEAAAIITKVELECATKTNIYDFLLEKIYESLRFLKLERLSFVMLHHERYLNEYGSELIKALEKIKKDNLVHNIGVSSSDKSELRRITDYGVFDCVQIPLNLFDNKELQDGTIEHLQQSDIFIFIRSVFMQGLFFTDKDKALPNKISSARNAINKISDFARELGISIAQLAFSFVRIIGENTSVVFGCETPQQIRENIALFSTHDLPCGVRKNIYKISEELDPVISRPWEWH